MAYIAGPALTAIFDSSTGQWGATRYRKWAHSSQLVATATIVPSLNNNITSKVSEKIKRNDNSIMMIKDISMTRSTKKDGFSIAINSNRDLKRNKNTCNILFYWWKWQRLSFCIFPFLGIPCTCISCHLNWTFGSLIQKQTKKLPKFKTLRGCSKYQSGTLLQQ